MFHRQTMAYALDIQNAMKMVVAFSRYCEIKETCTTILKKKEQSQRMPDGYSAWYLPGRSLQRQLLPF